MKPLARFRTAYNYDTQSASLASGVICVGPSKTQQQFLEETDINTIAKNFGLTGLLPMSARQPRYEDFSLVTDYKTAMDALRSAEHNFMQLPSGIREFFQNDPQQLLDFVENPKNAAKGEEIGLWKLFKPSETPTPSPAAKSASSAS